MSALATCATALATKHHGDPCCCCFCSIAAIAGAGCTICCHSCCCEEAGDMAGCGCCDAATDDLIAAIEKHLKCLKDSCKAKTAKRTSKP